MKKMPRYFYLALACLFGFSAVAEAQTSFRNTRPAAFESADDFPALPESLSGRRPFSGRNWDRDTDELTDGFDAPRRQFNEPSGRRRISNRPVLDEFDRLPSNDFDRLPTNEFDRLPAYDRLSPRDGRDPFVPAPAPRTNESSESQTIFDMITVRYQNPVNIRAIRSMSSSQAINLYAEVSRKIDERHIEPSSYDVRVRRALRNLYIALDNPAFMDGLGVSADSFKVDAFRESLSRLSDSMQVNGYQAAQSVMSQVMKQATTVPGLSPNAVAFEFANASLDTLDKFSGLEPSEVIGGSGAEADPGYRSAALEDEIVGVGVEVKEHAEGLLVVKPLRGGPAAEAGIQSGDVIIGINGRSISGMSMASSVDLMKGNSGSQMVVRIYREGKGEKNFTLVRRKVRVWTVNDVRLLDGTDVGYLNLSRFAQNSTAEMDEALMQLHKQGMKSLIVDLRGNPGGLLTTCIEISDRFLPCGTIVSTKGRQSGDNSVEAATYERTWAVPLVVLMDKDSASASEIFAAAVQENGRGVVVGTRSYGKGTVQTHFPLSSISGNLRLTTARFYSPTGRPMAGEGVLPDVEVEDLDGIANGDEVLFEAVEVARSSKLAEMAKASGKCQNLNSAARRSSSIESITDPAHLTITVR